MFDLAIICYLFLGGAGAGACLVAACLTLGVPGHVIGRQPNCPYRPLFASSFGLAALALALGIVFLIVDLGRFDRVLFLVLHPTATHIAVGSYALLVAFACSCVLALRWGGMIPLRRVWLVRGICVVGIAACVVVMLYTGLLLGGMESVSLWSGPWVPLLFVCSSASCGIALVVLGAVFSGAARDFSVVLRRLLACDAVLLAAEAACAVGLVIATLQGVSLGDALAAMQAGPAFEYSIFSVDRAVDFVFFDGLNATGRAGVLAAATLVGGTASWLFWIGFVGVGLVVPFVADIVLVRKGHSVQFGTLRAASVIALCVLVGGFALRFCLVQAGMQPALGIL